MVDEPRTALVTGGGAGIGEAICRRLARDGVAVGVLGTRVAAVEAVAHAINDAGGRAVGVVADVADRSQVEAASAEVRRRFSSACARGSARRSLARGDQAGVAAPRFKEKLRPPVGANVMDEKLREIIDRHEIWQVLQRYARGLDRLDRELVRSCYFDDAIEDHGAFVGAPDQFIDWADQTTLGFVNTHHGLMNHYCEIDGDDAHAETYYLFTGVAETAPHLLSMGRYIDHFQRRNGEWRIANRVAVIEKNFDLYDGTPWGGTDTGDRAAPDAAPATRDRNDVSYQRPLRPRQPGLTAGASGRAD